MRITYDKAKRLEKLINELFDISKLNMQTVALKKEQVNLTFMLYQMADEFYPMLEQKGQSMKMEIDEKILIYGEADKLARVFGNILKTQSLTEMQEVRLQCRRRKVWRMLWSLL